MERDFNLALLISKVFILFQIVKILLHTSKIIYLGVILRCEDIYNFIVEVYSQHEV